MTVDYRANKMDSAEGLGRARRLWTEFFDEEAAEIAEQVLHDGGAKRRPTPIDEVPDDVRFGVAKAVKEHSELMGFWLSWHMAGGFACLESAGWHRATIFRKVRQFRDEFGVHPDEAEFPFLNLDLRPYWRDQIAERVYAGSGD